MNSKSNHTDIRHSTSESKTDITAIYSQHEGGLKRFISQRGLSKEDAEDILQNVFYALAKIDLIENPIEQITSWLYSVTRNQIIDHSRKKREERMPQGNSKSDEDDFLSDISDILARTDDTPETEFLKEQLWEELELSLNELPEEQKAVFELTELQGFSFKEISESTGIPVNTLISRKRYAVLYLRKSLKQLYEDIIGE